MVSKTTEFRFSRGGMDGKTPRIAPFLQGDASWFMGR
jgi:hypothetical protein